MISDVYVKAGRLDDAEEAMRKACEMQENGTVDEGALARAQYAALKEVQGRMEEAKEIRLRGAQGRMVCANESVSVFSSSSKEAGRVGGGFCVFSA